MVLAQLESSKQNRVDEIPRPVGLPFQYTPLKQATWIRLLSILPGSRESDLRCSIVDVDLEDEPEYEALSYCWGDPSDPVSIFVNGMTIPIGRNLHSALFHLRHEHDPRVIWADAICINQEDLLERSQQVSIMGMIYSSAIRSVVWLGSLTKDYAGALSDWKLLAKQNEDEGKFSSTGKRISILHRDNMTKAIKLLDHPWFTRVWVVQEVALAQEVIMYHSYESITWMDLLDGILVASENGWFRLSTMGFYNPHAYDGPLCVTLVQNILKKSIDNPLHKLSTLLTLLRGRHATDPRDHIYSSLGMVENHDIGIATDYSSSAEDIYISAASHILQNSSNLDLLGNCMTPMEDESLNLPSWVPNWKPRDDMTPPLFFDVDESEAGYSAAGNTSANPAIVDDGRTLLLSGHLYDTVTELAPPLRELRYQGTSLYDKQEVLRKQVREDPDSIGFGEIFKRIKTNFTESLNELEQFIPPMLLFIEWEKFAKVRDTPNQAGPQGTCLEAYFRTLCVDKMADGYDETKAAFQLWYDTFGPVRTVTDPNSLAFKMPGIMTRAVIYRALKQQILRKKSDFSASMNYLTNRRLGWTSRGYLCLLPEDTVVGDQVWLFKGGAVPLVVRPDGDGCWKLVGESFIHGIMKGEKFDEDQCVDFRMR